MIEIVSHVYATKLPQYAVFLRAQLTSLVTCRPEVPIRVVVCLSSDHDPYSLQVANDFGPQMPNLWFIDLAPEHLFRRCIGRNIAAKKTPADLVWFADVDHVFGPGCLDTLWKIWTEKRWAKKPTMVYPRVCQVLADYNEADRFWKDNLNTRGQLTLDAITSEWVPKINTKAIGGIQITDGDLCRRLGYLDGNRRYQKPTKGDQPFPNFRDDIKFRSVARSEGPIEVIDLPNLYRLRHSRTSYQMGRIDGAAPVQKPQALPQ